MPSPYQLTHTTGKQLPSRVEERRRERLVRLTYVLRSLPREHVAERARLPSTTGSTTRSWSMPYCVIEATISSSWSFSMVYLIPTSTSIVFKLRHPKSCYFYSESAKGDDTGQNKRDHLSMATKGGEFRHHGLLYNNWFYLVFFCPAGFF